MIRNKMILVGACLAIIIYLTEGCASSNAVGEKIGVQLWAENCNRCHNSPSPTNFKDTKWEIIGTHMNIRAGLTDEETKKIIEFMQSAN